MTISIWRYSHLTLAISSFIFILIASVTGAILAIEPIEVQSSEASISNLNNYNLAETLDLLANEYAEVISLDIDENDRVKASVVTKNGKSETFFIHPSTGKKAGDIIKRKPIYKFATSLHRSLFLKSTGRFIVAFISFLLLIIAITGIILITKRQGGIHKFFSKIVKEQFEQYYHIVVGRFTLIPIIIITITGIYLSLEKFSLLPKDKINHTPTFTKKTLPKKELSEFSIFQQTPLSNMRSLEFPFSPDEEDYFSLTLKHKELLVHQYSGKVLSSYIYSNTTNFLDLSFILHTGNGSSIWAIILFLSCIAILFFIYSGFAITFQRRRKSVGLIKNKYTKDEAEFIILTGSETNNTIYFANALYNALLKDNRSVYSAYLNDYELYKRAKYLIVLTSTYGDGEAPLNAKKFESLLATTKPLQSMKYTVVGFGSLAYPKYCEYAIQVNELLDKKEGFSSILSLTKVNNQSLDSFKNWVFKLNETLEINLNVTLEKRIPKKQSSFSIVSKTDLNSDNTFLLELKPNKKEKFKSGDLLALYPEKDGIERLYSIARVNNHILLSIKKHELGICSNYLSTVENDQSINGLIKSNSDFHFPKKSKEVLLISNGTGIAPFLGMIDENNTKTKTHLFWGGRTSESFELYKDHISTYLKNGKLSSFYNGYSQEGLEKTYVQDVLNEQQNIVRSTLKSKGCIYICGSIAMMNEVLKIIELIANNELGISVETLKKEKRIKTDCY
ncbi:PepSY domain-containing protein [Tenacibaculum xiamenense]|uniref:PepSY domain-containing protein n=1 Tax=Tenacibaculum xiamenense TaxID=1261553 RepID=UPI0038945486